VWVIYQRSRQIEIHTPDKTILTLGAEDILEDPKLLPGFQLPLQAILK
jgi:Uma2 family endonuclease